MSTVLPDGAALVEPPADEELLEQPAATATAATAASAGTHLFAFKLISSRYLLLVLWACRSEESAGARPALRRRRGFVCEAISVRAQRVWNLAGGYGSKWWRKRYWDGNASGSGKPEPAISWSGDKA